MLPLIFRLQHRGRTRAIEPGPGRGVVGDERLVGRRQLARPRPRLTAPDRLTVDMHERSDAAED